MCPGTRSTFSLCTGEQRSWSSRSHGAMARGPPHTTPCTHTRRVQGREHLAASQSTRGGGSTASSQPGSAGPARHAALPWAKKAVSAKPAPSPRESSGAAAGSHAPASLSKGF